MHDPSLIEELKLFDERIENLREQLQKKEIDPAAVGRAVAAIYVDDIARVRAYTTQLELITGCRLFCPELPFEQNYARACAILRILRKLSAMLLKLLDRFLKCFGGPEAIAVQNIVTWAREDPTRGQWLMAFANARQTRRRA